METRLNDNEVKEVARMQQMIDSYDGFICALFMMMSSKKEINYPSFTDTNLDKEMNEIWRLVKEQILPIGDNKVLWDEDKKCYYIDGDLYVKGGISALNINKNKEE